jgi:hypothetical protein
MRCINMGYIERDFPRERDPEAEARAEFNRNAALSRGSYRAQPRRVERRRAELARNPIYTQWRDAKVFKLFIPGASNFPTLEKIKAYAIDHPASLMAISYDLATQINCLRTDDNHAIELAAGTLNQWKNNQDLKDIVRNVSVRFHYKLNARPLANFLATNLVNVSARMAAR